MSDLQIKLNATHVPAASRDGKEVFSFEVHMENISQTTVQVIGQHFYITDASGLPTEYMETGVQQQNPIIEPNMGIRYSGFLHMASVPAKVRAEYGFVTDKGVTFGVNVPEFILDKPSESPQKN